MPILWENAGHPTATPRHAAVRPRISREDRVLLRDNSAARDPGGSKIGIRIYGASDTRETPRRGAASAINVNPSRDDENFMTVVGGRGRWPGMNGSTRGGAGGAGALNNARRESRGKPPGRADRPTQPPSLRLTAGLT